MAQHDPIPEEHDVTRWIKPKLLAANDEGEIELDVSGQALQIFPRAFSLREEEEFLSLTWVNYFGDCRKEDISAAAEAFRASQDSGKLPVSGVFAIAQVARIKQACEGHDAKVRILEEPEEQNPGHVAVRRYPRGVDELYEELADEIFLERHFYRDLKP